MAQTILTGFDDVWVSSANYNTQKYSTNASEYRVFQFVIKRSVDGKLFFGYKVESLKANTVSVGVFDNGGGVYGSIQAKDKYGVIVGSSTGHDRTLSKWNNVDGNYAIMVYAVDDYPGVATVRYFGNHNAWGNDPDSNNLYVNIYYGSGANLGGSFEITTTSISSYLNQIPTLSLSSPPNNQTASAVSGRRTITISGTVSDANNDTVTVSATINGKTKTTSVTNTSTSKPWSLTWDVVTDNIAQGTYTNIVVTADDGQGGTTTATYTGTITVDKTNPVITISGVASGATYQNSVTPTFSATDSGGSGLASVTATLDGAAYTSGTAITASGSHTLVVTATDNAGNQAQQTVTFSVNKAPTLNLTSPLENLLGTDGNCEDTSKFTYTGGTAALDSTRKTQGNNSIKVTKSSASTYVDLQSSRRIYPAVGECYIVIADVYLENSATSLYVSSGAAGVSINSKYVTGQATGFVVSTTGVFTPVIRAFEVTSVSSPGVSYFYPRIYHAGTSGHLYNVDSFRVFKITKAQYDALPTNVDLATAQAIAAQYPYIDPNNNLTLSEGNTLPVQGTAGDTDNGNVVTVKYKINNGPTRAIASGVSDGSSPISFARTLVYSNKRLWDGSTDVAGVDLAEGVDHTLTVWAEDDQGGKSAEVTRKFRVIWNRPPTISGTDTDLGVISVAPSQTYTVSDPEGQSFTITEYLDGEVLRTFSGVAGQEYTVTIPTDKWLRTSLAQHTLKVRATDSAGQFSERTYTFTRTDDRIVFELDEPFLTDAKANRILVTLDAVIPPGASYIVEACNNAFDAQPTWEDVTGPVSAGRGYIFTNETKTAANWGVSIRFTFLKGTATEKILINGFGGAFD